MIISPIASGMIYTQGFSSSTMQSVVDLGFLNFRRSLVVAYLLFISIILKSSSTSRLQLLRGFPLFHVSSIVPVANCFVIL